MYMHYADDKTSASNITDNLFLQQFVFWGDGHVGCLSGQSSGLNNTLELNLQALGSLQIEDNRA